MDKEITTTFHSVPPAVPLGLKTRSGFNPDSSARPTGLLFFVNGEKQGACTASLVNSSSKKLVMTAAHCLHGGSGSGWYTKFMFVPNASPSGGNTQMYAMGTARVFTDWINNANTQSLSVYDVPNDIGFISVSSVMPDYLGKPVEVFGGHGFGHSNLGSFTARIVGYPKNPGNNKDPQSCVTKVETLYPFNMGDVLKASGCSFVDAHGASGSPWLELYDENTGIGWANGVLSAVPSQEHTLLSPRFNDRVYKLYNEANNDGLQ
ncbi:hypothetical protein BREU_8000 [Bifidobacterium reuteri DSM 23975]|uniref:Peptidase S1 domain-containing protein n=1 Tax=Bifidobacterium reuteri DSM 23975 TaxID=1437610 RepID=A0A087CX88_9BIFI|nr:hypothetical protein [Bifidobacterium reuteri]KFI87888.1 hypothetical protein BREU_8000 [Bifidobacterium reuteri DSM 23975]